MFKGSRNPVLSEKIMNNYAGVGSGSMTVDGVINKSFFLWLFLVASAGYFWHQTHILQSGGMGLLFGFMIGGFIIAMIISFKPTTAPFLAPVYAVLEGGLLGLISRAYNLQYKGIVGQAVMITLGIFAGMLLLYRLRIIRVTDKFRMVVMTAISGIFIVYMVQLVLGFFGISIPFLFEPSLFGIGFSLFVLFFASMMLALDFDMIEKMSNHGAPKYFEWYSGFALMVTLVWVYLEVLRLLSLIYRRN